MVPVPKSISVSSIPSALIVTAPLLIPKWFELKLAIPLLLAVAFSALIVKVSPLCAVSIPSPPVNVNVSPRSIAVCPLSPLDIIVLLAKLLLGILASAVTPVELL